MIEIGNNIEEIITNTKMITNVKNHLKTLSKDKRIEFIHSCMVDYCSYCGSELLSCYGEHLPCYCMDRDDYYIESIMT